MQEHTKRLLEECNSGCKMAVDSMDQIVEQVKIDKLREIISTYKEKHEKLQEESAELLKEAGEPEKEPGVMASTFSWFKTEVELMMNDKDRQAAKLLMDGCNMGIQSICKYENDFPEASKEATDLAKKLVRIEKDFVKELEGFM